VWSQHLPCRKWSKDLTEEQRAKLNQAEEEIKSGERHVFAGPLVEGLSGSVPK